MVNICWCFENRRQNYCFFLIYTIVVLEKKQLFSTYFLLQLPLCSNPAKSHSGNICQFHIKYTIPIIRLQNKVRIYSELFRLPYAIDYHAFFMTHTHIGWTFLGIYIPVDTCYLSFCFGCKRWVAHSNPNKIYSLNWRKLISKLT